MNKFCTVKPPKPKAEEIETEYNFTEDYSSYQRNYSVIQTTFRLEMGPKRQSLVSSDMLPPLKIETPLG